MRSTSTKSFFLLLLFLSAGLIAKAHTGSIKGGLYDAHTKKPIEGAIVYLSQLDKHSTTDVFGTYFFNGLPEGTYTIIINHIGYQSDSVSFLVEEGVTSNTTKMLNPSGMKMSEVHVIGRKEEAFNVISGIDMKLRPVNSAQDMLRMVPGLFISQHAGGGKAEQIFLRGFDVDHGTDVAVTVDGMPVNMVSHAHGQGYADLHFLIPELVEKVSFGKGPYRADKGNLATAGYVDFNTESRLTNNFVKMEAGSYGYFRTVGAINLMEQSTDNKINSAYVAGEYSNNRGYFDVPQNFNRLNLQGKYTSVLQDDKILTVGLSVFRSNWDASGQIPERAVTKGLIGRFGQLVPGEGGNTSRYNMNLQYTQSVDEKTLFKNNLYLSYYDFELYSNFTFFLNDSLNGDQIRQKEKRVLAGYNASLSSTYEIGGKQAQTEAGAGFRYDNVMNSELSRTKDRRITLSRIALGDINETNVYAYASQTYYLLPKLSVNAALRYDYFINDYYDKLDSAYNRQAYNTGTLTPKVNLNYNISNDASVFLRYGIGFHSNDTRVVVPRMGRNVLPLTYSYDAGALFKPFKKLLLAPTLWMMDMEDEFVYVGDEAVIESGGRSRRIGAELSARYEITKWLYIDGDATYTYARLRDEAEGENHIPLAPSFTATGGITLMPTKNISSSLRMRHIDDRPANEDYSVTAHGYTIFDAMVNYSRPSYEFGVQVQNLFNVAWNEAQFDTETRMVNEAEPISEIHFTPGTPFFIKFTAAYKF